MFIGTFQDTQGHITVCIKNGKIVELKFNTTESKRISELKRMYFNAGFNNRKKINIVSVLQERFLKMRGPLG